MDIFNKSKVKHLSNELSKHKDEIKEHKINLSKVESELHNSNQRETSLRQKFDIKCKDFIDANNTISKLNKKPSTEKLYAWGVKVKFNKNCQICDSKENLQAHHIFSKSEHKSLALTLSNGICLCETCHLEYHNRYNIKDCDLSSLTDFIKDKKNQIQLDKIDNMSIIEKFKCLFCKEIK